MQSTDDTTEIKRPYDKDDKNCLNHTQIRWLCLIYLAYLYLLELIVLSPVTAKYFSLHEVSHCLKI